MPAIVAGSLVLGLLGAAATAHVGLPGWTALRTASAQADFDGDGAADVLYLERGRLEMSAGNGTRYLAPRGWIVSDALAHDFDGDGASEIALVVWKRGSFGTSKPFWIERDTDAFTQHVFVMRYGQGGLVPVWMSSDLGEDVRQATFDEEGRLHLALSDGREDICRWDRWGFTVVDAVTGDEAGNGAPAAGDTATASSMAAAGDTIGLVAVGDNIMHLSLCEQAYDAETGSYDFSPVYAHVARRISSYDLAAVCQETVLVDDSTDIGDYPDFGTPEEVGDALAQAGFDIVASATNHACDRGIGGLEDTAAFWAERHPEISLLGLHDSPEDGERIDIVERDGMRFALFDATYGLNGHDLPAEQRWRIDTFGDLDAIAKRVQQAEAQADLSICFLHAGDEYAEAPNDEQRQAVERVVDAGADLVICSHPHVVQPVEHIRTAAGAEAVVFWSLGNFASHQTDPRTVLGGAAIVAFARDAEGHVAIASYALEPIVCHFNASGTSVYFLGDYTDELASAHYLSTAEAPLSVSSLTSLWNELTAPL